MGGRASTPCTRRIGSCPCLSGLSTIPGFAVGRRLQKLLLCRVRNVKRFLFYNVFFNSVLSDLCVHSAERFYHELLVRPPESLHRMLHCRPTNTRWASGVAMAGHSRVLLAGIQTNCRTG